MEATTKLLHTPSSNGASRERLAVHCLGTRPRWFDLPEAHQAFAGVQLECPPSSRRGRLRRREPNTDLGAPDVVHVMPSELSALPVLRTSFPQATLVLDLSAEGGTNIGWRDAKRAASADYILAGSVRELRELRRRYPQLARRTSLFRRPIDLAAFAPRGLLPLATAAQVDRLRQGHGLTSQLVLFAGPLTYEGGLDLAIRSIAEIQRRRPGVRLAAVPEGRIDGRYLERCRKEATQISSASLLLTSTDADELSLWYAAADVVCLPCREAVGARPAKRAAAAGKPFVGSEVEPLLEHVDDGETGYLLPSNFETLVAALEALLGDVEEAGRLGHAGRLKAKRELSPAEAAKKLLGLWTESSSPRVATL
jgi:glycosyltransferase involved in cell wall biosynthesis